MMYPGMNGSCCAGSGSDPTALVKAKAIQACSQAFSGAQTLNLAALLAQSGFGNALVYSVDIDVRDTVSGVSLVRGAGVDLLLAGDSRNWEGLRNESAGLYATATGFSLVLVAGDEVVINWAEVKE